MAFSTLYMLQIGLWKMRVKAKTYLSVYIFYTTTISAAHYKHIKTRHVFWK